MKEVAFCRRVCRLCGKVSNDEVSNVQHEKRREITVPECEMCGEKCSMIILYKRPFFLKKLIFSRGGGSFHQIYFEFHGKKM